MDDGGSAFMLEDVPPDSSWYNLMRAESSMMPSIQRCRTGGGSFLTTFALVGYVGKKARR